MENTVADPIAPHPLIARETKMWARYQALSRTVAGPTMITDCVMPRLLGYIQCKVEAEGRNIPPTASRMLEILEKALDDVGA